MCWGQVVPCLRSERGSAQGWNPVQLPLLEMPCNTQILYGTAIFCGLGWWWDEIAIVRLSGVMQRPEPCSQRPEFEFQLLFTHPHVSYLTLFNLIFSTRKWESYRFLHPYPQLWNLKSSENQFLGNLTWPELIRQQILPEPMWGYLESSSISLGMKISILWCRNLHPVTECCPRPH